MSILNTVCFLGNRFRGESLMSLPVYGFVLNVKPPSTQILTKEPLHPDENIYLKVFRADQIDFTVICVVSLVNYSETLPGKSQQRALLSRIK